MDSTINVTGQGMSFLLIPSPSKSVAKTESDNRKFPRSSIKAALTSKRKVNGERVVSLEGVMNLPEKVIDLSSLKRKRTTRGNESKLGGQPSSGGHSSSEEFSSKETTIIALYECPVVTDPDLRQTEENIPYSKNLFGTGVNLFKISGVESTVITVNPPLVGSGLHSDELFSFKTMIVEKDVQLAFLNEFRALVEGKEQQKQTLSDQKDSDFQWLMKEGIPSFLRAVMNSADFGDVNAAL
ncbi:unnamed protein product [Lactuca virosa]|uniref:Uncharacterized protein n=1 Tax=Lactuca virosa TaxID=75947 RepID=A0AAU9N691_9ASTR|nr:unnamed protein product [Lactuca virosa]